MSSSRSERPLPWLELILLGSLLGLAWQLFPGVWSGALALIDVRNWGPASYAAAGAISLASLLTHRWLGST